MPLALNFVQNVTKKQVINANYFGLKSNFLKTNKQQQLTAQPHLIIATYLLVEVSLRENGGGTNEVPEGSESKRRPLGGVMRPAVKVRTPFMMMLL